MVFGNIDGIWIWMWMDGWLGVSLILGWNGFEMDMKWVLKGGYVDPIVKRRS